MKKQTAQALRKELAATKRLLVAKAAAAEQDRQNVQLARAARDRAIENQDAAYKQAESVSSQFSELCRINRDLQREVDHGRDLRDAMAHGLLAERDDLSARIYRIDMRLKALGVPVELPTPEVVG